MPTPPRIHQAPLLPFLLATACGGEASTPPPAEYVGAAACAECHAEATVSRLVPTRSFCLACHEADTDHHAPRECTECHFQGTPESLRASLGRRGGTR